MMQEDQIFNQFKSVLEHYQPEVPQSVYNGVRRKMWLSQFMRFNAASLNVWYIGVFIAAGVGTWGFISKDESSSAQAAKSVNIQMELPSASAQMATSVMPCERAVESKCDEIKRCKKATINGQALPCDHKGEGTTQNVLAYEPAVIDPTEEGSAAEAGSIDPVTEKVDAGKVESPVENQKAPESKKPRKRYTVDSFRK
jgi:hypothetical protein